MQNCASLEEENQLPELCRILCVHPSSELYGADRVFLQVVESLRLACPRATITVLLPMDGPLIARLRALDVEVRIEPLFVLRRARMARTLAELALFPWAVARAAQRMVGCDLVYISTTVVADYLLATRWRRRPSLIHVHELPTGRAHTVISTLLLLARGRLLYISRAVRDAFPALARRPHNIIWNGAPDSGALLRHGGLSEGGGKLHLLLIGRFNAWKGQILLLDALALLSADERASICVRLLGSAFAGQEHFAEAIAARRAALGLEDCVAVLPFDSYPEAHYGWADVVVVPSILPEPFGLVAIEAMAAARAVIAADHGGLAEIVVAGETGQLVPPRDAVALADALRAYTAAPALVRQHGEAGRQRYEREFSEPLFRQRLADILAEIPDFYEFYTSG